MSGLEIAGFIIGLTGLATVFDKGCVIWRTIAEAQDFGEDLADWMRKLEMEFFRFQTWWSALEKLASRRPAVAIRPSNVQYSFLTFSSNATLLVELQKTFENPITNAATSIVKLLEDIEDILRAEGVLAVSNDQTPQTRADNAAKWSPTSLRDEVEISRAKRNNFAKNLMVSVSWWMRLKHDATPWRESHKFALEAKLRDMSYWNQALYDILPGTIKDSVLRQGISGYVLLDIEEASPIAKLGRGPLSESANLLVARQKLLEMKEHDRELDQILSMVRLDPDRFEGLPKSRPGSNFSLVMYGAQHEERRSVLIEWYQYPSSDGLQDAYEIQKVAGERLSKLSWLLHKDQRPSTLRAPDCLGCLESDALESFGLVSSLPAGYSASLPPVTLHDVLSRKPLTAQFGDSARSATLPTLAERFSLAASLASSLYTFMLARWHHKRFNSLNIIFPFPTNANSDPDLTSPFIAGFSVSRPNAPGEISVFGSSTEESEIYLHPDLRVPPKDMPKYSRKYEIYAFGLLLLEIGFWNTLSRLSATPKAKGATLPPSVQSSSLISKCKADMACWMGEQYQDITLRCLNAENEDEGGVGGSLNEFYWSVVLELMSCA